MILQAGPGPEVLPDDFRHMAGLILFRSCRIMMDLVPHPVLRPERLALAAVVVFDHTVGSVQNVGGGTIVLFQADGFCPAEHLFKVENILDGCAAEFVNALIIVAHHADIVIAACQQPDQVELGHAGVLILIHHHIAEFFLIVFPGFGVVLQHLNGMEDEIIEVHRPGGAQTVGVRGVNFGYQRRLGVLGHLGCHIFGREQLVLIAADLGDGGLDGQKFVVNHQILIDLLHDALLIVRVIDSKAGRKADALCIPAQNPHAGRVEGGSVDIAAHFFPQHSLETLLELPRRLVGEGDGQHIPGAGRFHTHHRHQGTGQRLAAENGRSQLLQIVPGDRAAQLPGTVGAAKADDVGNAVDQHRGFAGTGARQNQQRSLRGKNRLLLHGVQFGKAGRNIAVPQSQKFGCKGIGHNKSILYPSNTVLFL